MEQWALRNYAKMLMEEGCHMDADLIYNPFNEQYVAYWWRVCPEMKSKNYIKKRLPPGQLNLLDYKL